MSLNKENVEAFAGLMQAMRDAMAGYDVPEGRSGIACAKGTITARLNNINVITAALAEREPNAKDTYEFTQTLSTLKWLAGDNYVTKDFAGVDLNLQTGALAGADTFAVAIERLMAELTAMLEG
ncbi:hypothetical protein [Asticcacaulis sp. 201]|uniref:hypothetical protein n=1 Tax=Asticcacaulis sp. 201 TaxID=3028787 RepID=UPI002915DDBD|nr:hypothetical protein [Asticcacaulis sp. 201]MDV6329857.1 hypothetical protein [Asticcacaulis sp. 201]